MRYEYLTDRSLYGRDELLKLAREARDEFRNTKLLASHVRWAWVCHREGMRWLQRHRAKARKETSL